MTTTEVRATNTQRPLAPRNPQVNKGPAKTRRPAASRRSKSQAVVAIGDVHGCASLLEAKLEQHYGSGAELIFLGDLIDRSPEPDGDRKVVERVWALQQNPKQWGLAGVTVLRGNHEQMLLAALDADGDSDALDLWESNGGNPEILPWAWEHRKWFADLPYTAIRGHYLFVHAGVRPGVPLEQQATDDLIWIRQPFLSRPHGLSTASGQPLVVVHGHSITPNHVIQRLPHRIGIDTGAFCSGVLSSLSLQPIPANGQPSQ